MSFTDVLIGHRQNCTHGASGLICLLCLWTDWRVVFGTTDSALSVFTRAAFSVFSGAAAARLLEERMQEPWNSASRPRQPLDTAQLSQSLHDLESSDWNYRWRGYWWNQDRSTEWTSGMDAPDTGWVTPGWPATWRIGERQEVKAISDPSHWLGWEHYRQWKRAVGRWNQTTDVPDARRSDRQLKKLVRSLQVKFEHISDTTLQSQSCVDQIPRLMGSLCGERVGDDLRRAVRKAIFDCTRRSDKSLSMFVLRRESQVSQAESLGMPFPEQIIGVVLEEGAGSTQEEELNLQVLAGGSVDAPHMSVAVRSMDTTRQKLSETRGQPTYLTTRRCLKTIRNLEKTLDSGEERSIFEEVDAFDWGESESVDGYTSHVIFLMHFSTCVSHHIEAQMSVCAIVPSTGHPCLHMSVCLRSLAVTLHL